MFYYLLKIAITTTLIVVIAEVSKRSSVVGAILASVPLISVLAIIWLYIDTKDVNKVSELTNDIVWLIIPSLAFFISLPILLKQGLGFYPSMGISIIATVVSYWLMLTLMGSFSLK